MSSQATNEAPNDRQSPPHGDQPGVDSGSAATSDNRKVSREDIVLVQNLIERCLQLYMNRGEVIRTLSTRARIEPGFTTLVWQKLEEENAEFFRAYYIRLKLKRQIALFNQLLEHQVQLMKYPVPSTAAAAKVPLASIQNGIHHMPVNNFPMGYPVLQQPPPMPPSGVHPHIDAMTCGLVNGIPAPGNFHPIRMNSGDEPMESRAPEVIHGAGPLCSMSAMSDMAMSPSSAASSNHFPFTPPEMSGMGMDVPALDSTFGSDLAGPGSLQLGSDGGPGTSRGALNQLWNFNLSDLAADLTNLGDLAALENYDGTPFLPPDSDILLDSPEQNDIVEEYFADTITGATPSDEGKS